jgi:hypothetical protein
LRVFCSTLTRSRHRPTLPIPSPRSSLSENTPRIFCARPTMAMSYVDLQSRETSWSFAWQNTLKENWTWTTPNLLTEDKTMQKSSFKSGNFAGAGGSLGPMNLVLDTLGRNEAVGAWLKPPVFSGCGICRVPLSGKLTLKVNALPVCTSPADLRRSSLSFKRSSGNALGIKVPTPLANLALASCVSVPWID